MKKVLDGMSHVDKLNAISKLAQHMHKQAAGDSEANEGSTAEEAQDKLENDSPVPAKKARKAGKR